MKTCKFCGAELKHVNPCGDDKKAELCLERQNAIKKKTSR